MPAPPFEHEIVVAMYDHTPEEDNEIGFKVGDQIIVLEKISDSGWCVGKTNDGKSGLFPLALTSPFKKFSNRVIAISDYTANEPNELSFKVNDILSILQEFEGTEWVLAQNENTGLNGLCPKNFTKHL